MGQPVFDERVKEYQRNAAFVGFILVVCFSGFVYLTQSLKEVLVPLVWSGFFALPLTILIACIDDGISGCIGRCYGLVSGQWRQQTAPAGFSAVQGDRSIVLEAGPASDAILAELEGPRGHHRRVRIGKLRAGGEPVSVPEVNRLVEHWSYFAVRRSSPAASDSISMEKGSSGQVQLDLFLDAEGEYPAAIGSSAASVSGGEQTVFTGTVELDKHSVTSWTLATLLSMLLMVLAVLVFLSFLTLGVRSVQANSEAYAKGLQELILLFQDKFKKLLPAGMADKATEQVQSVARDALPNVASALAANVEHVGFQSLLFLIYLLFWIFEPLPVSRSVAGVFKSYLFLKSLVCLLFASLMSILLRLLGCPLWHLLFVSTFILNYVPEIGALVAGMLMLPAVLLNGNQTLEERQINTVWLIVFGVLFKVFTGNVIEVRLYAKHGGQHMRMHPVVMMALMMLCESLLGITGMFLAIPIMAAVKYYLVSADMPDIFLNPLLIFIEGDEASAHKNFVDRHREELVGADPSSYGSLESSMKT